MCCVFIHYFGLEPVCVVCGMCVMYSRRNVSHNRLAAYNAKDKGNTQVEIEMNLYTFVLLTE